MSLLELLKHTLLPSLHWRSSRWVQPPCCCVPPISECCCASQPLRLSLFEHFLSSCLGLDCDLELLQKKIGNTGNICHAVLEIPTGPPVRGRQLWRRTGNFSLIFLWFYVYDLRFKTWGPTTFLTEFPTLLPCHDQIVGYQWQLVLGLNTVKITSKKCDSYQLWICHVKIMGFFL